MIYCVVPLELEVELFERLADHYAGNPNVTVIVERRHGPDRRRGRSADEHAERRVVRDRRRPRVPGTFPDTDPPE